MKIKKIEHNEEYHTQNQNLEMKESKSLSIAFLGPDGSGKSTLIELLKKSDLPFKDLDYYHLKPKLKKNKGYHNIVVTDPHLALPYSALISYVKLAYFIFQYNLGWVLNILPLKKKSVLIIFDRYFEDILADPKRYRYGGKTVIAHWARNFIPSPDIYFILVAAPEVIYQRKQEVLFDELKRQVSAYRALETGKRRIIIEVSKAPEALVQEVRKHILEFIDENY